MFMNASSVRKSVGFVVRKARLEIGLTKLMRYAVHRVASPALYATLYGI
jgi:hypothetical protein